MKRSILFLFLMLSSGWLLANHWIPEDSQFEDNMTLTGVIQLNGEEQHSVALEVGVFCGEECRGSVLPTYFSPTQRYIVQLTIFGEVGDLLTFKLYDHESDTELELESPEAVTFTADGYGSLSEPYLLNFTDPTPPEPDEVMVALDPGWTWFGYLYKTAKTVEELFAGITPSHGDLIKGMTESSTYNANTQQWEGNLTTLTPGLGYMYRNQSSQILYLRFAD